MAPLTSRRLTVVAAVAGFLGVAIGAFGSHGLDGWLESRGLDAELIEKRVGQFEIGVRYHLVHAVALLAVATLPTVSAAGRRLVATWFVAGLVLFSGSLYLLAATNTPWLGAVTPFGGLAWLAGWVTLAVVAARDRHGILPEPESTLNVSPPESPR